MPTKEFIEVHNHAVELAQLRERIAEVEDQRDAYHLDWNLAVDAENALKKRVKALEETVRIQQQLLDDCRDDVVRGEEWRVVNRIKDALKER